MKKIVISIAVMIGLVAVAAVATIGYGFWLLQPMAAQPTNNVRFVIPKGQAIAKIADRLTEAQLIKNPLMFRLWVKVQGIEDKIQAGSFQLAPSMSLGEIAMNLTSGTNDVWVTIPEGWRREEIAESLSQQELTEFDKTEFLELTASSEGKLFPDTYLVPREATAQSIFNLLTDTFEKKVVMGLEEELVASGKRLDEVLTMASLVEREAFGPVQMKKVAGILWKRIEIGMPLQVDATLQYAKGYNPTQQSWWEPPLAIDRQLSSPFNTYANPGLPPRPIANPGLDAIKATLQPTEGPELFYIHDREGKMHYATTLEQHNRNVETYLR